MDPAIITSLVNAGGFGVMAAALFVLHTKSIERFDSMQSKALDAFRDELQKEREQAERHHLNLMQAVSDINVK